MRPEREAKVRTTRLLSFIELKPFTKRWQALGLDDLELSSVQNAILQDPLIGVVIEGTDGLRKLRGRIDGGKRGGIRICYLFIPEISLVILALVYAKNEKDDLSSGDKKILRDTLNRIKTKLLARMTPNTRKTT